VPIGPNEVGEPCRYQLRAGGTGVSSSQKDTTIYCGNWGQPSGRIFDLGEANTTQSRAALARGGPWRVYLDQRFACGAPLQTEILGGAPAQLMSCTRLAGGWPHIAMTAVVGGKLFAADGVRSALPAIEATMAALTGNAASSIATPRSAAQRLIATRSTGVPFGSGDEGRYFELTLLGDAYNNIDDPANAEQAYREALAVQQRLLGENNSGRCFDDDKTVGSNSASATRLRGGATAGSSGGSNSKIQRCLAFCSAGLLSRGNDRISRQHQRGISLNPTC